MRTRPIPCRQGFKFELGRKVITTGVAALLHPIEVIRAMERHACGDWGDLCPEDKEANEAALRNGTRLFSVYRSTKGVRYWVITEADRSATTVLLPEEY
jgi:hypothetical protein